MKEPMKIKDLAAYGIPSYILNIWERHYSSHLLPAQEEAVRNFGILDYQDKNKNLLVITPTSSGKTFIGGDGGNNPDNPSAKDYLFSPLEVFSSRKISALQKFL